jgi:ornithine cyclodeaminase
VQAACEEIDPVAIIYDVFRLHGNGMTHLPDEAYLTWKNRRGETVRSLNMPGYLGGSICAAGTKIINSNPANVKRCLPRASGLTLLFDEDSTRIECVMNAAYISALRTASVTMVAVGLLTNSTIDTVALIGAGVIAEAHVRLLLRCMAGTRVLRIYDIEPAAAERLRRIAQTVASERLDLQVASSAEEAIRGADIIIPATTTTEGYMRFGWLKKGALLVHVSLDDVLPEVVFMADLLVVDDWNLIKADSRRLLGRMYRRGEIIGPDEPTRNGSRRVDTTLADLVIGRHPGRTSRDQIVLVNPFGLAIEDVAFARRVYEIACARGLGVFIHE